MLIFLTVQTKFLEKHRELMDHAPDIIYYIYNDWQDMFSQYSDTAIFLKGWDNPELQPEVLLQKRNVLFLVDDSGDTSTQKDFLRLMFTKYAHHRFWSIILSLHNVFDDSVKHLRTISL